MAVAKPVSTPMSMMIALDPNEDGEAVNQRDYKSMIGSLLYLTATQLNIQFPTYFTSSGNSVNLQVFQTNSGVWNLVFCFFFAGSC
jgi:hypothetical protein